MGGTGQYFPGGFGIGAGSGAGAGIFTGQVLETVTWGTGPAASELASICHNQNRYYGLGLAC